LPERRGRHVSRPHGATGVHLGCYPPAGPFFSRAHTCRRKRAIIGRPIVPGCAGRGRGR
jgi:hypothetical protein